MPIKRFAKRSLRALGYVLVRLEPGSHFPTSRQTLFETLGISLVLDVGANTGQFAEQIRNFGYKDRILSFEPLSSAYEALQDSARADVLWETFNYALGNKDTRALIYISSNSYSSSLLRMLPSHVRSAPESAYIGQEEVAIKSLDSVCDALLLRQNGVYLKIDAQGYENEVLNGAARALEHIDTIQLEMSVKPLYEGALLFDAMHERLSGMKYRLVGLEPGFTDNDTGELLQFDGIYHRYTTE